MIRSWARRAVPRRLFTYLCERFPEEGSRVSYSQEGEDLLLGRLFGHKACGVYVDVGAHHPTRYSNTYYFYKRGWSGINIDAMPGSMQAFQRIRPRDVSLEAAISNTRQTLTYYMYNWPAMNTFSEELHARREKALAEENAGYRCIGVKKLTTRTLAEVLEESLPAAARKSGIDFLSVDVEGLDLDVLKSNDWSKFRPRVVVAEILRSEVDRVAADPVSVFLGEAGYMIKSKCINSVIFMRAD